MIFRLRLQPSDIMFSDTFEGFQPQDEHDPVTSQNHVKITIKQKNITFLENWPILQTHIEEKF